MIINPWCACPVRVTVVGLPVCLSVCLSVSQLNIVIYSMGNEGQKLWDFLLRFSTSCIVQLSHVSHFFSLCGSIHMHI